VLSFTFSRSLFEPSFEGDRASFSPDPVPSVAQSRVIHLSLKQVLPAPPLFPFNVGSSGNFSPRCFFCFLFPCATDPPPFPSSSVRVVLDCRRGVPFPFLRQRCPLSLSPFFFGETPPLTPIAPSFPSLLSLANCLYQAAPSGTAAL